MEFQGKLTTGGLHVYAMREELDVDEIANHTPFTVATGLHEGNSSVRFNQTTTHENYENVHTGPDDYFIVKTEPEYDMPGEEINVQDPAPETPSHWEIREKSLPILPKTLVCKITTKNPLKLEFCCGYCSGVFYDLEKLKNHLIYETAHRNDVLVSDSPVIQMSNPVCDVSNSQFNGNIWQETGNYNNDNEQQSVMDKEPINLWENRKSMVKLALSKKKKNKKIKKSIKVQYKESANENDEKTYNKNKPNEERRVGQKNRKRHQCKLCPSNFTTASSLRVHYLRHDKIKQYPCSDCNMEFYTSTALRSHSTVHSDKRDFSCPVCKRKFKQKRLLKTHLEVHSLIRKTHKCPHCQLELTYRVNLKRHIRTQHSDSAELNVSCPECNESFVSQFVLESHIRIGHVNLLTLPCSKCGDMFAFEKTRSSHMTRYHSATQVFASHKMVECEICFKVFKGKAELKVHLNHHTKPFLCNVCGKACSSVQALDTHISSHSDANIPCDLCKKKFRNKFALRTHKVFTHEGKYPGICSVCGVHFKTKFNISKHMRRKHPEFVNKQSFNCTICSVVFQSQKQLDRHVIFKHTNDSKKMQKGSDLTTETDAS